MQAPGTQEDIRITTERTVRVLERMPAVGRGTAVTKVRVRDGFTCDVEDGRWRFTADLSEKAGGRAEGPDPGVYGRAALGSCLAASYVRWAAVLGVPLEGVEVTIEADYDARGEYGVGDASPGYEAVRFRVRVESAAPEAEVLRLLDEAERRTPWLDVFRRPHTVQREVEHVVPAS